MKSFSFVFDDIDGLHDLLEGDDFGPGLDLAGTVLATFLVGREDPAMLGACGRLFKQKFPAALVVGGTVMGEICDGVPSNGRSVLLLRCFDSARLSVWARRVEPGQEFAAGRELALALDDCTDLKGVSLLATPQQLAMRIVLDGIESHNPGLPLFGGGVGTTERGWLMHDGECFECGLIVISFCGQDLEVGFWNYLGWVPVGRRMQLGEADGMRVRSIDQMPAIQVWERYLDIVASDNFFYDALEFPLLVERDGQWTARIPIAADPDGSVRFSGDVIANETASLGYGNIDIILDQARPTLLQAAAFGAESLFLYSCGSRCYLMRDDIEVETQSLNQLAPASGLFTYGEFCRQGQGYIFLNAALLAVGMREGPRVSADPKTPSRSEVAIHHQAGVLRRLIKFNNVLTEELSSSNRELNRLSHTDALTGLANRLQLDERFAGQLNLSQRHQRSFALILLDIDHFKLVNDGHGHAEGDRVLIQIAHLLTENCRSSDCVGRWGGEEFLLLLPETDRIGAGRVAEKLRLAVVEHDFADAGPQSASFGVTAWQPGDTEQTLFARTDEALYAAKHAGRNRVEVR